MRAQAGVVQKINRVLWALRHQWLWHIKNTIYLAKYWSVRVVVRFATRILKSNSLISPLYRWLKEWNSSRKKRLEDCNREPNQVCNQKNTTQGVSTDTLGLDEGSESFAENSDETQEDCLGNQESFDDEFIGYRNLVEQMKPLFVSLIHI